MYCKWTSPVNAWNFQITIVIGGAITLHYTTPSEIKLQSFTVDWAGTTVAFCVVLIYRNRNYIENCPPTSVLELLFGQ